MAVTKRHVNKALVVNIPLQSHFIKGLVFILHTHPFLCSGKHTHPEESFLPLAQSTQLSQWIWLDAFKVPDIPAVLSFNQPFPFTWRAGCTHFCFSILAICGEHSYACVWTLLCLRLYCTLSPQDRLPMGHTGCAPCPDLREQRLSGAQPPSHKVLWALPVRFPCPAVRGLCSFPCRCAQVLFIVEMLSCCQMYWVYFLPVHQSVSLPFAIIKKTPKKNQPDAVKWPWRALSFPVLVKKGQREGRLLSHGYRTLVL